MTMTYGQISDALRAAIIASLPESEDDADHYVYVLDFSDAFVVYCIGWQDDYLQDDYTMDDDGNTALAGSPVVVEAVTTYEPASAGQMEQRGMAGLVADLRDYAPRIEVRSEPPTYRPDSRSSFFRDMALEDKDPDASERLGRHRREMKVLGEKRAKAAQKRFDEGGFEYRVEPNTTQGTGGYFAPPLWLNQLFAPGRHAQRALADLIPATFLLPSGVSSINLPIINTGSSVQTVVDDSGVSDTDITDAAGSSIVAMLSGQVDVALQLLEQSPPGAYLDWAFFKDLTEAYDADLEGQLLYGLGAAYKQFIGLGNISNQIDITYTDTTPTGPEMWPYLGQAFAQIGDARQKPPEAWFMRSARWAWLNAAEDTTNRPLGLPSPFFMGSAPGTPDPISGIFGLPVFLDEAIPANLGTAANQDFIVLARPSDLVLLEGEPQTSVMLVPGSGNLSARLQFRNYAAAITNRFASGVATVVGSGMAVQTNF